MHSAWASGMMYGVNTALVFAFAAAKLATSDYTRSKDNRVTLK